MTIWIGAALAIALLYGFVRWQKARPADKIEAVFSGRQALSQQVFFERYFQDSGVSANIVMGVRQVLQEQLGVDLSCLSRQDDFAQNLKSFFDFDKADGQTALANGAESILGE